MPTTDTTYALPADLKPRLRIPGTSSVSDALLLAYLNAAAIQVDTWTRGYRPGLDGGGNNYEAFSAVAETRAFDDDLSGIVAIDDLLSVTAVTRGQSPVDAPYYKLWPYNRLPAEALFFRADLAFQPIILGGTWYEYPYQGVGSAQTVIAGTWGFCPGGSGGTGRPAIVKEATLRLAAWAYTQEGVTPKDKMAALRDPTRPFYWEIQELIKPLKRSTERMSFFG